MTQITAAISMLPPETPRLSVKISGKTPASFFTSVDSVSQIVLYVLDMLGSACLFYVQRNLFILGFAVGFIFDQKVYSVIKKVSIVYNAKRSQRDFNLLVAGGTFSAMLTMPTSLCIFTLYRSAELGAKFYQSCRKQVRAASKPA